MLHKHWMLGDFYDTRNPRGIPGCFLLKVGLCRRVQLRIELLDALLDGTIALPWLRSGRGARGTDTFRA